MNKAFVSEPEPAEPRCPTPNGCDSLGQRVTRKTLESQLSEDQIATLADKAYYCSSPGCLVAYFDDWGTAVPASALRTSAYPKDPEAPICPCFGVSAEEIRTNAEAGSRERIRELLEKAESHEARCETCSPSGESCVTEVRRLFLQHFQPK